MTLTRYLWQYVRDEDNVGKAIENDKVPNIPITFLSNYPKIVGNLTGASQKEFSHLLRKFRDIDDEDVQYYANTIE